MGQDESMIIAETRTYTLGKYTVRQRARPDNPAFAQYLVYRGERYIGASFSIPDLACCEWLEHSNGVYARKEDNYVLPPLRLRGAIKEHSRRSGRQRREDSERELAEAIAGG